MKLIAVRISREELPRLSPLMWLLVMFLQIDGSTAFAYDYSFETGQSKWIKKGSQYSKGPRFPRLDKLPTISESAWSKLPLPKQRMLDSVLDRVKSVRIIDCAIDLQGRPYSGGYDGRIRGPFSGNVVFESADPSELKQLTGLLRIREERENKQVDAYESGAPVIELTLVDGNLIYIGFARGFIRWKEWRYDAYLLNPRGFAHWLTSHGIAGPLPQSQGVEFDFHDNNRWEYEESKAAYDVFARAMPRSLRAFFRSKLVTRLGPSWSKLEILSPKYENIPRKELLELFRAALSRQLPNATSQIGELLEWDGKLTYSKLYLDYPLELLLEYNPSQVLSKVKEPSLSPAQWVGVSRYYSSYQFGKKFPSGYKPLNRTLRQRIIRGVKATKKNELDLEKFRATIRNWK